MVTGLEVGRAALDRIREKVEAGERLDFDDGLTLIVGRIEDDWLLARILGFGVLYGRGTLFGKPRLVKAEVVADPPAA